MDGKIKKESKIICLGKSLSYLCSSVFICGSMLFLPVVAFSGPTPVPTPDNHPLFEKAQQYFKEKKYKEAKQILNQLVAKASPLEDYIPKARLLLANLQDDFSVSIAQFKSLAAEYNNSPEGEEAQKNLGSRYYLADKYQEAVDSYEEYIKDYPKSVSLPEINYWYASSLSAMDKNQEAIDKYKKVLEKAPDSAWAPKSLLGMGNAFFKMKKYSDARKQYLRILDQYHLYDELNLVYFKLGQTYEMENKPKEAHAAFQTLTEKYPKSLEVDEANAHLEALEKQHPELAPVRVAQNTEATPTPELTPPPAPDVPVEPTPTPLLRQGYEGQAETDSEEAAPVVLKSKPFHVQVGVYSKKLNVAKAQKAVKKAGYKSTVLTVRGSGMAFPLYKVRVGSFEDRASAEKLAKELTRKTKEKAIVVED